MNPIPLLPFDPTCMIESVDELGFGLRIVFFKSEAAPDRYAHWIATVEPRGEVVGRLLSLEGMGSDAWPLSPPLQSLSIEERPAGAVALLVGMSGQSHWSASFEAIPARREIIVDLACRVPLGTEWHLGS